MHGTLYMQLVPFTETVGILDNSRATHNFIFKIQNNEQQIILFILED